jgi:general L-amino acid transport system substrate-binding protein
MRRIPAFFLCIVCLMIAMVSTAQAGETLGKIKAAGSLACGINIEQPEYTMQDAHGNRSAFDIDICRAVAVAVLGKNAKLTVLRYHDEAEALKALEAGAVDVLATASPNFVNTTSTRLGFAPPIFYDYQGFLVNQTMGISSPRDLEGKKVCVLTGTEIERQLQGYMARQKIHFLPFAFSEEGEMEAALVTRNCAAVTADVSQLAYERIAFKGLANDFEILPDAIGKDPLAPAYRLGDPQWSAIVNWTMEALIQAEESGVTQSNVAAMRNSQDPVIRRLLGTQHGYGQYLGLDDGWAEREIEAVGNYGEMFARDLGSASPMKLSRGPNNLWTHGGLMYSLPMR